jgi:hypothetical protein
LLPDITIKRHDVGKVMSGQLLDADGAPVNCTGFTSAKLFWTNLTTDSVKINGATFTFSAVSTGTWSYTLTSGDVDTRGYYKMELEVGFAGGVKQSFPTDPVRPYMIVLVQDDLG